MIRINSLKKVYPLKKKKNCEALCDISLTLPDSGLVFVLGKSGSGKSTLLNLIGGLDNITQGKIEVNGNDVSSFKEKDFCNYRNTHIGFIFQDYHLLDELTVKENIALSLNLTNTDEQDLIKEALLKVDLSGYEDRYPLELSGGERQRVAIARAIVKKPGIILADEPTGNLDTVTSKAIIELLRDLSKDCLVLIVSHNLTDANKYADRIIELRNGKVISDKMRNPSFMNEVTLCDEGLLYPEDHTLSDKDIELINKHSETKLIKQNDKFIDTSADYQGEIKTDIDNNHLPFKHQLRLFSSFIKNKTVPIVICAIMVSVIMVIMALAQTIIKFDSNLVIENEMKKAQKDTLFFIKSADEQTLERFEDTYRVQMKNDDIAKIIDSGYTGNLYPVLNTSVPVTMCQNTVGISRSYFSSNIYIRESLGTIITDEEFFIRRFGSLTYAASLKTHAADGVIITDYLADSIIATNRNYKNKTYDDLLGDMLTLSKTYGTVKINAVIDTGYKTKHKDILERIKAVSASDFNKLYEDSEFQTFVSDVYESLGFSYSLNPDYIDVAHLGREFYSHGRLLINDTIPFVEHNTPFIYFVDTKTTEALNEGEASMSYEKYNQIFGTSFDRTNLKDFIPHTIKITSYRLSDIGQENPLYTVELKIAALHTGTDTFILSRTGNSGLIDTVGSADVYYNALYCEGRENIGELLDSVEALNYDHQGYLIEGIRTMTKAVEVFVPIFELIAIFLCIGVILILTNFSSKMINDKMHEIGILKAIGMKNNAIAVIFGLQVILIAILTCILATVGYAIFIDFADGILIDSLKRLAPGRVVMDLNFLTFRPKIAVVNCLLILSLTTVSIIVPLLKIKAIKPVKIIKAKE